MKLPKFTLRKKKADPAPEQDDVGVAAKSEPVLESATKKFSLPFMKRKAPVLEGSVAGSVTSEAPAPKKSKKQSKRPRKIRLTKATKFVLFLGDEGAIAVYLKGGQIESRQFSAGPEGDDATALKEFFAQDADASILMVVDTMDQSFVQQTLPPVASLSVGKLIKRRLDREFSDTEIKGALSLGRDKAGRKEWQFLMIALEKTKALSAWLDLVLELPNHFEGIRLLATEIMPVVDGLAALREEQERPAKWQLFVSRHKVGGVRHILCKGGKVFFTRLTHPVNEDTPEVIAGSIEQEILSTLEYIRRLSYQEADGLDITLVAGQEILSSIEPRSFPVWNVALHTPYELAQLLGVGGQIQESDQYADAVLSSVLGRARRAVLSLHTHLSRKLDHLRWIRLGVRGFTAVLLLGMIGNSLLLGYEVYSVSDAIGELTSKQKAQQSELEEVQNEVKKFEVDIDRVTDTVDLQEQMKKMEITPLYFFARLSPLLGEVARMRSVEWKYDPAATAAAVPALPKEVVLPPVPGAGSGPVSALLSLEFQDLSTVETFQTNSAALLDQLKQAFPGYDIAYEKTPGVNQEAERLNMTLDDEPKESKSSTDQFKEVRLQMRGPLVMRTQETPALVATPAPPLAGGAP